MKMKMKVKHAWKCLCINDAHRRVCLGFVVDRSQHLTAKNHEVNCTHIFCDTIKNKDFFNNLGIKNRHEHDVFCNNTLLLSVVPTPNIFNCKKFMLNENKILFM